MKFWAKVASLWSAFVCFLKPKSPRKAQMPVLETYFESPHRFGVAFSALGGHYDTTIGGLPVTVSLPKVRWAEPDGDWIRADLVSPEWTNVPEDHPWHKTLRTSWPWGSPSSYHGKERTGSAWVSHFRVSTQCSDDADEAQVVATTLLDSLDDWWPAVCEWIEVLTGQAHGIPSKTVVLGDHHPAWTAVQGIERRLFSTSPQVAEIVHLTGDADAIEPDLFQAALDRAVVGPPPTEWLLIRDGRVAHHSGSNRRAVIDAGTATELALTKIIEDHLVGTPAIVIEQLLAGHRMLSNRLKLVKKLGAGSSVPSETHKGLVEPRNVATHQGSNLTAMEAREALRIAAIIVDAAYPLASFR